jgi:pimeloyl-ACP methyl ester carboxylesterase
MENVRKYGTGPYNVAVIHGGPGAPGSIAPVARELSTVCSVLEPLQTAETLDGQVEELEELLKKHADLPAVIIGWSHGSGLSCLLAARHPDIVEKLVIIGTTPFNAKYQAEITGNRLLRLNEEERAEFFSLADIILDSSRENRSEAMAGLFRLANKADSYALLPLKDDVLEYQPDINISIGKDWRRLLDGSELLKIIPDIKCPVVAIQGDYDVNPAEAVKEQFSPVIKDFRFFLLEKCGHCPWYEKYARDRFYDILKQEIKDNA